MDSAEQTAVPTLSIALLAQEKLDDTFPSGATWAPNSLMGEGAALMKQEMKRQCWLACPMILISVLQYSLQTVSLMMVGHLDELSLASTSIASSIATVTGSSLLMSMACALETLGGQAYGAQQYELLGLYLQRGLLVLNAVGVPLAIAWANMEHILLGLGQDPIISRKAAEYTQWLIPALFAYATSQPLVKFLQVQSLVFPLLLISIITFCTHVPICWFMVHISCLEARGAALATSISSWITVMLLIVYVRISPSCKKTCIPFTWKAFHDLKAFLKLAFSSAMMICLEWWSYEVLILLSGLLPNPELEASALSICYNIAGLAFMVPLGLGTAASTRVANELGAGQAKAAYTAVHVSLLIAATEAIIMATIFVLLRKIIGHAFSNEEEVISYIVYMMPILAAGTILDSFQGVLSGIVRGCGWQRAGAYINLVSYYGMGLPAAFFLAFILHTKAAGLWLGICSGSVVQLIALLAITWATNWETEAIKAINRLSLPNCTTMQPLLLK